ncbi:hypothetical protein F4777DRAFT_595907 [Nemania sp. FL0916]|nr:hypothetical protein F4777DRAFT_595907 [Nemania sp. FL0916]
MPVASDIPGTLKGYDLVLSLSAEALNAQFQELYDKPIPSAKLPRKGLELNGLEPLPVSKYYINHELKILPYKEPVKLEEGEEVEGGEEGDVQPPGIHGYIECPKLSFNKEEANIAVMSIKFKDELVGGEVKKSYLRYDKAGRQVRMNITGWTMSWEVEVRSQGVENYMEDLINASKDPEKFTIMTDEASEQLEKKFKTLDPSKFMASTVFCLFEDARITRSFKLKTAAGTFPKVQEQTIVCTAIGTYFSQLKEKFGNLPCAETPYVLGYGISQKPAALVDVNADAKSDSTPPYFIPRRFDMSVTPSRSKEDEDYTSGTVNFCLQTYRADKNEEIKIVASDKNAGSFEETFFKVTSTKGTADGDNGIMTFSKKVFNDYWIRSLLDLVDFNPKHLGSLLCMDGMKYYPGLRKNDKSYEDIQGGHGMVYTNTYEVDDIACPDEFAYKQRRRANGVFQTWIRYASDLEWYDQIQRQKPELHRRGFIDIEFKSVLYVNHETKGLNAVLDGFKLGEWRLGRTVKAISRYRLGFNLLPGAGGTFIVEADPSRTTFPQDANAISPVVETVGEGTGDSWSRDIHGHQYGTYIYLQNHNTFENFGQQGEMDKFKKAAFAANGRDFSNIDDKLQNIFSGLKTTVILPAGNVFTFKGINTDKDGNLHTSVNYRSVSKAQVITKM